MLLHFITQDLKLKLYESLHFAKLKKIICWAYAGLVRHKVIVQLYYSEYTCYMWNPENFNENWYELKILSKIILYVLAAQR